jgi:predicted PurR-regulated permease PerM
MSLDPTVEDRDLLRRSTEVAVRLVAVTVLAGWCFLIFQPFIPLMVWGLVLAVALYPAYQRLVSMLDGRRSVAATIFVALGIGLIAGPAWLLSESFYEGLRWLSLQADADTVHVPPPPDGVAEWPLIGERVATIWGEASTDLPTALAHLGVEPTGVATWLLSTASGLAVALAVMIAAVVLAGLLLLNSDGGARTAQAIGVRLAGEKGTAFVDLATESIRSVATGVVGVAAVQAVLAAIGLVIADVPAAGLWAGIVLVLAVAQLPPLLVLGPAIAFVWMTSDSTVMQVFFTVWSLVVSVSDSFLKPLFLGRGMDIPMPVILIGAIGGMLRSGIIGLFVGAVVLAVGYSIFTGWLAQTALERSDEESSLREGS